MVYDAIPRGTAGGVRSPATVEGGHPLPHSGLYTGARPITQKSENKEETDVLKEIQTDVNKFHTDINPLSICLIRLMFGRAPVWKHILGSWRHCIALPARCLGQRR